MKNYSKDNSAANWRASLGKYEIKKPKKPELSLAQLQLYIDKQGVMTARQQSKLPQDKSPPTAKYRQAKIRKELRKNKAQERSDYRQFNQLRLLTILGILLTLAGRTSGNRRYDLRHQNQNSQELAARYRQTPRTISPMIPSVIAEPKNVSRTVDFFFPLPEAPTTYSQLQRNSGVRIPGDIKDEGKATLFPSSDLLISPITSQTPLHKACQENNIKVVRELLSKGADFTLANGEGKTAFDVACQKNALAIVRLLLEYGYDPEIPVRIDLVSEVPITHLFLAVHYNNNRLAYTLLKYGRAQPYPLLVEMAIKNNNNKMKELLQSYLFEPTDLIGVNTAAKESTVHFQGEETFNQINQKIFENSNRNPYPGFHIQPLGRSVGTCIYETYVDKDGSPKSDHWTFSNGESYEFCLAILLGRYNDVVRLFPTVDRNYLLPRGYNWMILSSAVQDVRLPNFFLHRGLDVNQATVEGETALHTLAGNSKSSSIPNYIAAGANVNAKNNEGITPLCVAIFHHNLKQAEELLDGGASPYIRDKKGRNAGIIASEHHWLKELNILLLSKGMTPFSERQQAIPWLSVYIQNEAVQLHPAKKLTDEELNHGKTLLAAAIKNHDQRLFDNLLEQGAYQGDFVEFIHGNPISLLHVAAIYDEPKMLTTLLELGESLSESSDALSVFSAACNEGNLDIVQELINRGQKINIPRPIDLNSMRPLEFNSMNRIYLTELHQAVILKDVYLAELLLRNGADPTITIRVEGEGTHSVKDGMTLAACWQKNPSLEMKRVLLKYKAIPAETLRVVKDKDVVDESSLHPHGAVLASTLIAALTAIMYYAYNKRQPLSIQTAPIVKAQKKTAVVVSDNKRVLPKPAEIPISSPDVEALRKKILLYLEHIKFRLDQKTGNTYEQQQSNINVNHIRVVNTLPRLKKESHSLGIDSRCEGLFAKIDKHIASLHDFKIDIFMGRLERYKAAYQQLRVKVQEPDLKHQQLEDLHQQARTLYEEIVHETAILLEKLDHEQTVMNSINKNLDELTRKIATAEEENKQELVRQQELESKQEAEQKQRELDRRRWEEEKKQRKLIKMDETKKNKDKGKGKEKESAKKADKGKEFVIKKSRKWGTYLKTLRSDVDLLENIIDCSKIDLYLSDPKIWFQCQFYGSCYYVMRIFHRISKMHKFGLEQYAPCSADEAMNIRNSIMHQYEQGFSNSNYIVEIARDVVKKLRHTFDALSRGEPAQQMDISIHFPTNVFYSKIEILDRLYDDYLKISEEALCLALDGKYELSRPFHGILKAFNFMLGQILKDFNMRDNPFLMHRDYIGHHFDTVSSDDEDERLSEEINPYALLELCKPSAIEKLAALVNKCQQRAEIDREINLNGASSSGSAGHSPRFFGYQEGRGSSAALGSSFIAPQT